MSDIDKRLAAFKAATEVTAPAGFKQRVIAKVRGAAVLPLAAAVGWYGGIGIKTLIAATVIAAGTAAYQVMDSPEPPAQPAPPVATVAKPLTPGMGWSQAAPRLTPGMLDGTTADAGERLLIAGRLSPRFIELLAGPDAGRRSAAPAMVEAVTAAVPVAPPVNECPGVEPLVVRATPLTGALSRLFRDPAFLQALASDRTGRDETTIVGFLKPEDQTVDVTKAQGLKVFKDGSFLATGTYDRPVFVVLPGHLPGRLDFPRQGGGFYSTPITLARLTPATGAQLTATIETDDPAAKVSVTLVASVCGQEKQKLAPQPVPVTPETHGNVTLVRQLLAPVPHFLGVSAPGYAPQTVALSPRVGVPERVRIRLEREIPFKAEMVIGAFDALPAGLGTVVQIHPAEPWAPEPSCVLPILQEARRYRFDSSVRGANLGPGSLGVFQSSLRKAPQIGPLGQLELNSVYLLQCEPKGRWVLARFFE